MLTERLMRENRTPLLGGVAYEAEGLPGRAAWQNISRVGACVALGRYLRPGRRLTLLLGGGAEGAAPVEARAQVMWCRDSGGGRYRAGLRLLRDDPSAALAFAALCHEARQGAPAEPAGGVLGWMMI